MGALPGLRAKVSRYFTTFGPAQVDWAGVLVETIRCVGAFGRLQGVCG